MYHPFLELEHVHPSSFPFLAASIFGLVATHIHKEPLDIKVIIFALVTLWF